MTTVYVGKWCVYGHYVDGKCIYVGMGRPWRAFNVHKRSKGWFDLTRDGYQVEILSWHETSAECLAREIEIIREIAPVCNKMHNGWVPEGFKANWKRGPTGIALPEATKRKMSEARKRAWAKVPEGSRNIGGKAPIRVICVETGETYKTLSEAAKVTGVRISSISMAINGHKKLAGGMTFVREDVS